MYTRTRAHMLRCTHETQLPAHARSLEQRAIIIRSTYNPTATCSTRTRHFACTAAMIRAAPPQVAAVLEASSAPSRAQLPHLSTSHIGRATVWHRFSQPIAANPLSVALPAALERGREAAWIKLAISRSVQTKTTSRRHGGRGAARPLSMHKRSMPYLSSHIQVPTRRLSGALSAQTHLGSKAVHITWLTRDAFTARTQTRRKLPAHNARSA